MYRKRNLFLPGTADLLKDLSQKELQELTDLNGEDAINETVLADVIKETARLIASYLPLPSNPSVLLKTIGARLSVHELKRRNGLLSVQDHKDNEAHLLKMANSKLLATTSEAQAALADSASSPLTTSTFVQAREPLELEGWQ